MVVHEVDRAWDAYWRGRLQMLLRQAVADHHEREWDIEAVAAMLAGEDEEDRKEWVALHVGGGRCRY